MSAATLAYYVKRGDIERLGHGVYRGKHAPRTYDFRWEDLFDTVQKVKGGVVCLTSALALYDLTDEIPRQHWIAIRNDTAHRSDPTTKIVRMRNIKLGKSAIKIGKIMIPIFDRERTILDAFRYLSRETALKALKSAIDTKNGKQALDVEKLRRYSKTLHVKIEPYLLGVMT